MLCGCGSLTDPNNREKSENSGGHEKSTAAQPITIGLSQIGSESDWRMASTDSVKEAFSSSAGYNLIFDDAQQKQENQLKAIREFIDQGVDYIILDPIVETGWDSVLSEAKDAGIPVIVYDRRVDVADDSLYACWIGSDFYLEGERTCKWLADFFADRGIDHNINIINIQGTMGATAQIGRSRAIEDAVYHSKNWRLLAQESGEYTTAKGKEVMKKLIAKYGENIDVVYVENDNMAYGVIDAIKGSGYKTGSDIDNGEILVVSFDASHNGLQLTLDGAIAVDTECNPLYGPRLAEIIEKMENGKEPEKETYIEEDQFSAVGYIASVNIQGKEYPVTYLTSKIIDERVY